MDTDTENKWLKMLRHCKSEDTVYYLMDKKFRELNATDFFVFMAAVHIRLEELALENLMSDSLEN